MAGACFLCVSIRQGDPHSCPLPATTFPASKLSDDSPLFKRSKKAKAQQLRRSHEWRMGRDLKGRPVLNIRTSPPSICLSWNSTSTDESTTQQTCQTERTNAKPDLFWEYQRFPFKTRLRRFLLWSREGRELKKREGGKTCGGKDNLLIPWQSASGYPRVMMRCRQSWRAHNVGTGDNHLLLSLPTCGVKSAG